MLSKIIWSQKDKYYMIPLIEGIKNSQFHRSKEWKGGLLGLGEGRNGEFIFNRHKGSGKKDKHTLRCAISHCTYSQQQ